MLLKQSASNAAGVWQRWMFSLSLSGCSRHTSLPFPSLPALSLWLPAGKELFVLAHLVDQSLCAVFVSGHSQVCIALTAGVPLQGVQEGQVGGGPSLQLVLLPLKLLQSRFAALPIVFIMQPK